jgi:hypothetical protein
MLFSHNNLTPLPHHTISINNNNSDENDNTKIFTLSLVSKNDNTPTIKYLGVYFDPDLSFKHHISHINRKLSLALYSLRQVSNILPSHSLKTLYYSLFHCHLTYAIEIWSNVPPSHLQPLFKKQKAAIRIIAKKSYNCHTEPLFKSLAILPLPDLISYFNLKLFHSFKFNYTPPAFINTWTTTLEQRHIDGNLGHLHNLRNNDDIFVPPSRTLFLSRFPYFNLPVQWNNITPNLKDQPNKYIFSHLLKKHFIDKLAENFVCNRLLCPACLNPRIT